VGEGKDYTLYSLVDGIVVYQKKPEKSKINVYPLGHPKAELALAKMHETKPKEGVPSRAVRRKAAYKPRAQQRAEAAAVRVATVVAAAP
jgi:large subunit ribosomal protein L27